MMQIIPISRYIAKTSASTKISPAARKAQNKKHLELPQGTDVTVRESAQPAQIIYGRMRTGGAATFVETNDNSNASLTTGSNDNQIVWLAKAHGEAGNVVTIAIEVSTHASTTVAVSTNDIVVHVKSSAGVSQATANDVITAVKASGPASALVNVGPGDGRGTDYVQTVVQTALSGGGGTRLYQYITLAGHQIDAIESLYLDKNLVAFGVGSDTTAASGRYSGRCKMIRTQLGAPGQTVEFELSSRVPEKWTSDCIQSGCAGATLILNYENNTFPNGLPEINFVVRGMLCYDPRTSTTVWTQNAALIVADFLNDSIYGFGIPYSSIDSYTLAASANVCDELITLSGGGTEPRYTINGTFDASQDRETTLQQMLASMGGDVVYNNNTYFIYPAAWRGGRQSIDPTGGKNLQMYSGVTPTPFQMQGDFTLYFCGTLNGGADGATNYTILTNEVFQVKGFTFRVDGAGMRAYVRSSQAGATTGGYANTVLTQGSIHVFTFKRSGGTLYFYIDGVADGSCSFTDPITSDQRLIYGGTTQCWKGWMHEFVFITHASVDPERTAIEGYLIQKWIYNSYSQADKAKVIAYVPRQMLMADMGVTSDASGAVQTWLDQSGNGYFLSAYVSGPIYSLRAAANYPTLKEDDLSGQVQVVTHLNRADSFNCVSGTFIDPASNYVASDIPAYKNSTYISLDGGKETYQDLALHMVTSSAQGQRLFKILLERARQGIQINWRGKLSCIQFQCGDVVAVNLFQFGWAGKLFEVQGVDLIMDNSGALSTDLLLRETAPGIFDWANGSETTIDLAPNTNLPDPTSALPPTALTLQSGTAQLYLNNDGTVKSRLYVSWTASASEFVVNNGSYEVQFKKNSDSIWSQSYNIPGTSSSVYLTDVQDGTAYDVQVRSVNTLGYKSAWVQSLNYTVLGKTAPPSDVANLYATVSSFGIRVNWDAIADLDADLYEVRVGGSNWATATFITQTRGNVYSWPIVSAGTYLMRVKAIDTSGNYSTNDGQFSASIVAPASPVFSSQMVGANVSLAWSAATSQFAIKEYEIRYGTSYDTGSSIATITGLSFSVPANWSGTRTFWIVARDVAGNQSSAGSVSVNVVTPTAPNSLLVTQVDNNILMTWAAPSNGSLPIDHYNVYKGSTFGGAALLGRVAGTFITYIETLGGAYTYWVTAVDTAGNEGAQSGQAVIVFNPPDYTVKTSGDADMSSPAASANCYYTGDGLLLPVNVTETWAQHFTNNSQTSIAGFESSGFTYFAEPTPSTAYAEWSYDIGVVLAQSMISMSYIMNQIGASVTAVPKISYKHLVGDAWTDGTAGQTSVFGTNFQFIKVRIDFTGSSTHALAKLTNVHYKVDAKKTRDSGVLTVNSGDAGTGGTVVTFNQTFSSVDSVQCTYQGSVYYTPIANFAGGLNPTSFKIILYDKNGTAQTGTVGWDATGILKAS